MKFLIFGASGPIGFNLFEYFKKNGHIVKGTYFRNNPNVFDLYQIDISDKEQINKIIKNTEPDFVIDCVALAGVDLAETDNKLAHSITVVGTQNIIQGCKPLKNKIIYVSTSYVYSDDNDISSENSMTEPSTYYGKTKLLAEKNVIDSDLDHIILRTDQPYFWTKSWQRDNSIIRLLKSIKNKQKFNEIVDWNNNPTYIPDISQSLDLLIQKNKTGIYNIVGNDFVNRYHWSVKVAEIFGLDTSLINPIQSSKLKISIKRPNINSTNKKLLLDTGYKMKGIVNGASSMKTILDG